MVFQNQKDEKQSKSSWKNQKVYYFDFLSKKLFLTQYSKRIEKMKIINHKVHQRFLLDFELLLFFLFGIPYYFISFFQIVNSQHFHIFHYISIICFMLLWHHNQKIEVDFQHFSNLFSSISVHKKFEKRTIFLRKKSSWLTFLRKNGPKHFNWDFWTISLTQHWLWETTHKTSKKIHQKNQGQKIRYLSQKTKEKS